SRTTLPSLSLHDALPISHPSYAQGYYDRDNDFYVAWEGISRDPDKLTRYLEEFVYGVPDRAAYMKKQPRLAARLKAKELVTQGRSEEHTSELQSLRHLVC